MPHGLALADLPFTVSQAPGGMIPSAPVERPSLGHPLPWATTSVVNPPPQPLPLRGEGVFKFSENLTVLSLALCFLKHLPAGHWGKVAQPTQDLEISSPWNLRWQGFKDGLHQRAPSFWVVCGPVDSWGFLTAALQPSFRDLLCVLDMGPRPSVTRT